MSTQTPVVRVGVAAVVRDVFTYKMIMGIRKGSHGVGHWQFPGGHLEFGETPFACAERETLEETGLVVHAEKIFAVTNDFFEESGKHYITLFVKCRQLEGMKQPETMEPEKCEGWFWKSWEDIRVMDERRRSGGPQELFLPIVNLLREYYADLDVLIR